MMQRKSVEQMARELTGGNDSLLHDLYIYFTKNDKTQYAGVDKLDDVSNSALPVVYAKIKRHYEKKLDKKFVIESGSDDE